MTDKERYKRTFALLHASGENFMEVSTMKKTKIMPVRRFVSICAAALLIAAMATVAYANDLGGIQTAVRRSVAIWVHGEQQDATMDIQNGDYSLTYRDENGKEKTMYGGGVAIGDDGSERPLTEEELLEELNRADVEYKEDGTVWVYYRDQVMEITDQFEDGVCRVTLGEGDDQIYLSVRYQDGYTASNKGYAD